MKWGIKKMTLSQAQKEFIGALHNTGVSEKVLALMLMLLPEEQDQRKLSIYIADKMDSGAEITDDLILHYLMGMPK